MGRRNAFDDDWDQPVMYSESAVQSIIDQMNTRQFEALLKWQAAEQRYQKRITELEAQVSRLSRINNEIYNTFFGANLSVSGWHLNGNLEPMDNFFDNNDWSEVEA
jgi:hypothetical protein